MKTHVIQLEPYDDVVSACDRLSWSKAERVLLVWPRRGRVLERKLDLVLLARRCQKMGSALALVASSERVQTNARECGIPVFDSIRNAQHTVWQQPPADNDLPDAPAVRERMQKSALLRLQGENRPRRDHSQKATVGRMLLFSLGVLPILALLLLFIPSASITLPVDKPVQQLAIHVWASPELAFPIGSGGVPARLLRIQVEGSRSAESSGTTALAGQYAGGEVTLTNLTNNPVTLPIGLLLQTETEPILGFVTLQEVLLAAGEGASAAAPVRAVEPGASGNVAAEVISAVDPAYKDFVRVTNTEPLRGGSETKSRSPNEADYTRLAAQLLADLREKALHESALALHEDEQTLPVSLKQIQVVSEERSPEPGYPSDTLTLTLQVEYEVWAVRKADLEYQVRQTLDANLEPGWKPDGIDLYIEEDAALPRVKDGRIEWTLQGGRILAPAIDPAEVARTLAGKESASANAYLNSLPGVNGSAVIKMFPPGWPRFPYLPFQIKVQVK